MTYGPFKPNQEGESLPERLAARQDLFHLRKLGANSLRLYEVPPLWFLNDCAEWDISVMLTVPWTDHVDFLNNKKLAHDALVSVRKAAELCVNHPAVCALLVGNEINGQLVRWLSPRRVMHFLEDLIDAGREIAPSLLFSYATYPTTEYLLPQNADFAAFNVYLEDRKTFAAYLARLQNMAGDKPLVISEFGVDTTHHGEEFQAQTLQWEQEECLRQGVAGNFIFSFTDEWHRGGQDVKGWTFGVVKRNREEKAAADLLRQPPPKLELPLPKPPSFSIVVCTYNGERTLQACLESLSRLQYPAYEVLVVDDGSTDRSPEIARGFETFRFVQQDHAGLSNARNLGASLATGEIIAYTDDDCLVDAHWLLYLSHAFVSHPEWLAVGGPNVPPPPRNATEACVAVAPGGPAHVLLNDVEAEHIPGCNMAVRKEALVAVGGFKPEYVTAGDDVDFCWRLHELAEKRQGASLPSPARPPGSSIGFHPAAMVWHYRRFRIREYFRQQAGYGRAEALLVKRHPERFSWTGGARWAGVIYGGGVPRPKLAKEVIFHGSFGFGQFQSIYAAPLTDARLLPSTLLWVAAAVFLLLLGWWHLALGVTGGIMLLTTVVRAGLLAAGSSLPLGSRGLKQRLLLTWLNLAQPLVRTWYRYSGLLRYRALPLGPSLSVNKPSAPSPTLGIGHSQEIIFKSLTQDRSALLRQLEHVFGANRWTYQRDDGWSDYDYEVHPPALGRLRIITLTEYHAEDLKLTRVRLQYRLYWSWILPWLAGLCGALLLHAWPLALFLVWAGILLSGIDMWRCVSKGFKACRVAAKRCGLKEHP